MLSLSMLRGRTHFEYGQKMLWDLYVYSHFKLADVSETRHDDDEISKVQM